MINIQVLSDLELVGIVGVLSNSQSTLPRNNDKYRNDIYSFFNGFKNHDAVKQFKILENTFSFNFDKPISLMLDYKDDKKPSQLLYNYVGSEAIEKYKEFYQSLSSFKSISNFQQFFAKHKPEYKMAVLQFKKNVPIKRCINFLEKTTNTKLNKNCIINLMFSLTSANYGWQTTKNYYCNIRPSNKKSNSSVPFFANDKIYIETLIVHEFGHSIINKITDNFKEIINSINNDIFIKCFENNPYNSDKITAINETIIRAIEILYVKEFYTKNDVINLINDYNADGFNKIKEIAEIINNNKTTGIDEYYAKILNVFNQ